MGSLLDNEALVLYQDRGLRKRKMGECKKLMDEEIKSLALPSLGGGLTIGIESEVKILVDNTPSPVGHKIASNGLGNVKVEVLKSDVEIDSHPFRGTDLLTKVNEYLGGKLAQVDAQAVTMGGRIIMSGIAPTMREQHLIPSPNARYPLLDYGIREARNWEACMFRIPTLDGEVVSVRDDVWAIGYTNAFHLHINPEQDLVAETYNAVLGTAAVGLAPFVSSPIISGQESVFDETRIPIIEQAIDPRTPDQRMRGSPHRSDFANWSKYITNVREYYTMVYDNWSHQQFIPIPDLLRGATANPNLDLLIGTTWTGCRIKNNGGEWWIEDRWKPSGPTVFDDVAYAAWKTGLALAYSDGMIQYMVPEGRIRSNILEVARKGMDAMIYWGGEVKPVSTVILDVMPLVGDALDEAGVSDWSPYLDLVFERAINKSSPALRIRQEYRKHDPRIAPYKVAEFLRDTYESGTPLT